MIVTDIAFEIYSELGKPTDTSVTAISFWLRTNIGQLNSAINTYYYLNTFNEIEKENDDGSVENIGIDEAAVYKQIYHVHYFDLQIKKNVLSFTSGPVVSISADGHNVRMSSPTEIGRTLYTFRKDKVEDLKTAITAYKTNQAKPKAIHGDDTEEGI